MLMAVFKFVISDNKKSYQVEKDQKDCPVVGKKIGNILSGEFLGLAGYGLKITGGSDKDGIPMRRDIDGTVRKRFIVTKGAGFNTDISGLRRRKMLRGNAIDSDIIQINCKITKKGGTSLDQILGKKEEKPKEGEEPAKEEKKADKPKEEAKPKEAKKDEKPAEKKEEKKSEAEPKKEKPKEEKKPDQNNTKPQSDTKKEKDNITK